MRRFLLFASLFACDPVPEPPPVSSFAAELEDAAPAYLAVVPAGEALIAVGGPLIGDGPPSIARRVDRRWEEVAPPSGFAGAAWWAWAASADDVWVVGEGLHVARGALGAMQRVTLPPVASATVATLFGVWGSSANDVWMVGGSTRDRAGPQGLIFRWDGQRVHRVPLTGTASSAANETLFKVWGSSASDVTIVGASGVALHFDGRHFRRTDARTRARLLTVHGRGPYEQYAVGGTASAVVQRWDGFGWRALAAPGMPPLNGVYAAPGGDLWVAGVNGFLARFDGAGWEEVDTGVFGRDFHGVHADARGVFAAGGQLVLLPGPRKGIIGRYGPP